MGTDGQIPLPTEEAIESAEKLYYAIRRAFPEAVTGFESKWTAFQEVCQSQTTSASLDVCAQTAEFEALKRLGPKILPLVVFKLARDADQNSYGVILFNALENDRSYRGNPDEPLVSKEVLRRHSSHIVERNHQRNKIYEERIGLWKEYCWEHRIHASCAICTGCEEYFDLVEMGSSIIAHLMVEYFHDRGGYWYELLHEIVHGRKMGAYMVQRDVLFEECRQFFNEGEHDHAPKYIPNEWDIYIHTRKMGPQVREYFRQFDYL
ncbi:hypothetical protein QQS21_009025 [Conoideocrella luteorostrata]|uniref:Uncharacterized protein n=1 Tax=Conoideocrella luteorostrata TaxID=1105319 RepID=A0AAJ0CHZ0_9HYPO|nr:hypothetical protein QQS21_009025 [Conoideocrella luteorostrata]